MKRVISISLLILMSLLITEAVAQTYLSGPTNVTATGGDRTITVEWEPPIGETLAVLRYNLYPFTGAGISVGNSSVRKFTLTQSHFTNIGQNGHPINGQTYSITVRAIYDATVTVGNTTVSVTPNIPAPTGLNATLDSPTTGDRSVILSWIAPSPVVADITGYEYRQEGGTTWRPTNSNSPSVSVTELKNAITYNFKVRAVRGSEAPGTASDAISVTPLMVAPGAPGTLNVERNEDTPTFATLTWSPPSDAGEDILRYEYSEDGGSNWHATGSTDPTYTVTGLEAGETYTFLVRAIYVDGETPRIISPRSPSSNAAVLTLPNPKRRIIQDCPVGWVRSDGFAGRTRRVLIYEVKLDMDMSNLVSIYKPDWVAIYVHPDEALENLEGWKLQVALPYNHHSEYLLTAENSVIVDSRIEGVAGGFAFIENPEASPFPMTGMGFTGSPAPGFDYRLYDETGRRVDFGIACYKRFDVFQVLKEMEDPRVLRQVLLETFDWDQWFLRSEWTVPVPVNAPGAPSLVKKSVVGTWAALKKQ